MSMTLTGIAYNRNGVHGCGFYAVTFAFREVGTRTTRNMVACALASLDDEPKSPIRDGMITTIDATMAASGNVVFGENSWRYEQFETTITDWIIAWDRLSSGLFQHGDYRPPTAAEVTRFHKNGSTPYASALETASP